MHRQRPTAHRAVGLVLVFITVGLVGCLGPDQPAPGLSGDADEPSDDPGAGAEADAQTGAEPGRDPAAAADAGPAAPPTGATIPDWSFALGDERAAPWDPLRIVARVTWNGSLPDDVSVEILWRVDGEPAPGDTPEPDHDAGMAEAARTFTLPAGPHAVEATARLHRGDSVSDPAAEKTVTLNATVWAPLRLIVNASDTYASNQNVFREDRVVPFASWTDESAFDLLKRMGSRHGFAVEATYREDLDSWFVDAINGTAFQWEQPEILGISRNWMLLRNGEETQTAVDDTFPAPGDVVEFRFVRCHSTGQCEGT